MSLSLYYLLVIAYRWRESQLRNIRYFLHGIPLTVGTTLAFGILPVHSWIEYGCHLLPYPDGDLWKIVLFAVLPIGFSVLCISSTMILVYCIVRRTDEASRRWRFGASPASKKASMRSQVFWQAILYTVSFYVTWPIMLAVYVSGADTRSNSFGFAVLVAFVAPLQGFSNFLVYIRPRMLAALTKHVNMTKLSLISQQLSSQTHFYIGKKSQDPSQSSSDGAGDEVLPTGFVDPSVMLAIEDASDDHDLPHRHRPS